jgi:ribonuclease HI
MKQILVFTDGAAKGNPGAGGYGAVVLAGEKVIELGARKAHTTNNEMELKAVVEALAHIGNTKKTIAIYTDSKYVVEGAKGWIFGWMKNGWKTKAGTDVINKELWQELASLLKHVTVEWHKVPGHVGIIGNERADAIASDFGEGKSVQLYMGAKSEYEHDIENVSYDTAKAEARSDARKRQNQKAHSYISLVDGVVMIHATWTECEARVKGKKAKFKKAVSEAEEKEIIASFKKG